MADAIDIAKYVDQRFLDLESRLALVAEKQEQAVEVARRGMEQRLGQMNELREQINRERGSFVSNDLFRAETKAHADNDDRFHTSVDVRLRAIENILSNYAGRLWAVGVLAVALATAIGKVLK